MAFYAILPASASIPTKMKDNSLPKIFPEALMYLDDFFSHHILIAEKSTHQLHLFKNKGSYPEHIKTYQMATGKKAGDKLFQGDHKTPEGIYNLGPVYYRKDRISRIDTQLKILKIEKTMGWCDDVNNKNYNKIIRIDKKIRHEKLFRKSRIYDILIPINYNTKNIKKNKGSAIFIHLTKNIKKP